MDEMRETLNNVLVHLFNQVLSIEEKYLNSHGVSLTINEIHLLDKVRRSRSKTMGDVAKALDITQSTLSITSKRLVRKGFLIRERDIVDKRIIRLQLTDIAKENLKKHDIFHKEMIDALVVQFQGQEQEYLRLCLNTLVEFFDKNY